MKDKIMCQLVILFEVFKDFVRWAFALGIGWLVDNGATFFTGKGLSPETVIIIGVIFKYLDYYWHRYNKATELGDDGESKGIIPF